MINDKEFISRRQYLSICFLALLSPIIRQLPRTSAQIAGTAAWLSALAAIPWLVLFELMLFRLLKRRGQGEGMGEIFLRVYGKGLGRIVLTVYALWMLAYCGFVIRSGADRMLQTAYPQGGTTAFILVMGVLALISSFGPVRALARTANIFRPILLLAVLFVIVFALPGADLRSLLPVSRLDAVPVLLSGLPTANVFLIIVVFTFLENRVELSTPGSRTRSMGRFCLLLVVLVTLLLGALLANFGPDLTLRQANPFFATTRNISLFGSLERIEALVIALWVLTDFVLIAALLQSAITVLRLVFSWESKKLLPALCTAAAVAFAAAIAHDSYDIAALGEKIFPLSGAVIAFGLFPLTFVVGLIRRRI